MLVIGDQWVVVVVHPPLCQARAARGEKVSFCVKIDKMYPHYLLSTPLLPAPARCCLALKMNT